MARLRRSKVAQSEFFPGFTDIVEIGVGSLATVYRAREIETSRLVALKLLNVRDASPRAVESFERESVALGALSSHPHIVTLYRSFRAADGRPVLVLELCAGSIGDRLQGGTGLPVAEVVSLGIKIAGALETAHRAQILHRDVKPQNILVTEFGQPSLADFGVAMLQSSTQTTAGLFDFTTLHAAPELLEGGDTSAATDVYELASTLYQLIAGRSAFRAYDGESPASVILRILRDPVQPLNHAQVPPALSDLLIRAMSKDKEDRPRSAAEFADRLGRIEIMENWPQTQFLVRDAPTAVPMSPTPVGPPAAPPPAPTARSFGSLPADLPPQPEQPRVSVPPSPAPVVDEWSSPTISRPRPPAAEHDADELLDHDHLLADELTPGPPPVAGPPDDSVWGPPSTPEPVADRPRPGPPPAEQTVRRSMLPAGQWAPAAPQQPETAEQPAEQQPAGEPVPPQPEVQPVAEQTVRRSMLPAGQWTPAEPAAEPVAPPPAATPEPEPLPAPEPAPQPETAPAPETEPAAEPVGTPEPAEEPDATPEPEPAPTPQPAPASASATEPAGDPAPQRRPLRIDEGLDAPAPRSSAVTAARSSLPRYPMPPGMTPPGELPAAAVSPPAAPQSPPTAPPSASPPSAPPPPAPRPSAAPAADATVARSALPRYPLPPGMLPPGEQPHGPLTEPPPPADATVARASLPPVPVAPPSTASPATPDAPATPEPPATPAAPGSAEQTVFRSSLPRIPQAPPSQPGAARPAEPPQVTGNETVMRSSLTGGPGYPIAPTGRPVADPWAPQGAAPGPGTPPAPQPPPVGPPPPTSDLTLDPAVLSKRVTIRAGTSALTIDEHKLVLRSRLRRTEIAWPEVVGFEPKYEGVGAQAGGGHLVVLTRSGPHELPATRRSLADLRYLQALLEAYWHRARTGMRP